MPAAYPRILRREGGRHPKNLYAALLAVCASSLLHALLIRHCPSFVLGRASDLALLKRAHAVVLDKVLPDYRPEQLQMERPVRPEDPGRWAEDIMEKTALSPLRPAETAPSAWTHEPKAPVQSAAPASEWDARQQVVSIEERIYADEVSALPRRFADDVPRSYDAADMRLQTPEEIPAAASLPPGGGYAADVALPVIFPAAGIGTGDEMHSVPAGLSGSLLEEAPGEISEMEPVEDLLALNISVFRPRDEEWLYFQIGIGQQSADALPVLSKQLVFLQDCSESMTAEKVEQCKEGLMQCVNRLAERDEFNIMAFREDTAACYPAPVAVTPLSQARARWFINDMQSRGNTDVYAPLRQVLAQSVDATNPVVAVLITDGRPTSGMLDTSEIIDRFTQSNQGRVSVFTVGGGQRVNRMLLDFLSYKNRGDAHVVMEPQKIPETMTELLREISRPVLTGLDYQCAPLDEGDIYPSSLTHLYLDRPLMLYGRCHPDTEDVLLQITGTALGHGYDMIFPLRWDGAGDGGSALRSQWVWHRIYDLMGRYIRDGNQDVLEEMQSWASRYGLVIPYTFTSEEERTY
ncbi:MAG TPA: VWA domain-containing protein [Kiritimatiellia bacterium]|nr:VWA domain-containing protein [Kiritimatiellia bacterium]HNS79972.1 VWA domain-containing protein [Kiritimatiellia bacterium]